MTVQPHYLAPELAAEILPLRDERGVGLVLQGRGRETIISVEGDVGLCAELLNRLRRDRSFLQSSLRGQTSDAAVELARSLDQLGWITDADRSGEDTLASSCREIESLLDQASRWLTEASRWRGVHGLDVAEVVRRAKDAEAVSFRHKTRSQLLLTVLLNSWRQTNLLSEKVFLSVLDVVSGRCDLAHALDRLNCAEVLDATDPLQVRNEVWAASLLLFESLNGSFEFAYPAVVGDMAGNSGINAMLLAEDCLERVLEQSGGATRLFAAIGDPGSGHAVAKSVYLHQYFVTQRYVQSVMNLLQVPLRSNLKTEAMRYLMDEVGHDDHEREACLSLGIPDYEIRGFAPFPYFVGYIALLDYLALKMPVAFCMSVAVAEGMPGQRKRIADAINAAGYGNSALQVHTDLDVELDHSRFPRLLMKQIPWIEGKCLQDYLRAFLTTLETSQLAWLQLAKVAELGGGSPLLRPFERSPEELSKIIP